MYPRMYCIQGNYYFTLRFILLPLLWYNYADNGRANTSGTLPFSSVAADVEKENANKGTP